MRKRLVALGMFIGGAALAAEEGSLSIEDLVRRQPSPSPRTLLPVATTPAIHDGAGRRIAGEAQLLESALAGESLSWLDGQSVCAAIDGMIGADAQPMGFDERAGAVTFDPKDRDRVAKALAELRARAPGPIALRVSLERVRGGRGDAAGETLLQAEGHADPSRTVVFADAIDRRVAADYDVELAQASSIGDPILALLRTGVSVALCVTPMPDGRSAVVETVARASGATDEKPYDLGHEGFGTLDRCSVAFDELGSCFRVENGRAGEIAWTGRDGARMRLRVEASWKAPPPAGEPAVVVSPLFRSEFAGFRHVPATPPRQETEEAWAKLEPRPTRFEELAAIAFHDPGYLVAVKGGESVAVLPATESSTAAQQAERISLAADQILHADRVRVIAVNAPAGSAVTAGSGLPEGAFVVASYEGPVVRGLAATSTGGTEMLYLADWDVEVAQSSRIPDPLVEPLATGHFLNFTLREGALDLDLDLSRLESLERQEMRLAVGRRSLGVQGDKDNGTYADPMLPTETVAVEKPVVAGTRIVASIPIGADGTGSLRRGGGALVGRDRELVVLVSVGR